MSQMVCICIIVHTQTLRIDADSYASGRGLEDAAVPGARVDQERFPHPRCWRRGWKARSTSARAGAGELGGGAGVGRGVAVDRGRAGARAPVVVLEIGLRANRPRRIGRVGVALEVVAVDLVE